jgi:uncharacterized protein with GYD domain
MAKYLFQITYTETGLQEILKEGGSVRRQKIDNAVRSLNGWLEAIYFSFGEADMFVITELPDNISAAALSMIISSGGAARLKTTVLIAPEEIDKASQEAARLNPMGQ